METTRPEKLKIASSLSSFAAKSFGASFYKDSEEGVKKLRNVPHLAADIIPTLPPFLLKTWWELHCDPTFSKFVDSSVLAEVYELYEAAYLHIFKGKPLEPSVAEGTKPVPLPLPEIFENPILDVWNNWDTFVLEPLSEEELKWPKMYYSAIPPKICGFKSTTEKVHSLVPKDIFLERFHIFTNNQFKDWTEWDNTLIIGGTMVACGQDIPVENSTSPEAVADYYHHQAYPGSDIDIYLYGLDEKGFRDKVMTLWRHLLKVHNGKVSLLRTTFTLTFVTQFPK